MTQYFTRAQAQALAKINNRLNQLEGSGRYGDIAKTRTERRVLAQLVEMGEVEKVGYGCYSFREAKPAVRIAHRFKAKLTCISALEFAGIRLLNPPEHTHIALPRNRGVRVPDELRAEVVVHRDPRNWLETTTPIDSIFQTQEGFRKSTLLAPWLSVFAQIAQCQPLAAAVVAIDAGLSEMLINKGELLSLLHRHRYPQAIRAVELSSRKSDSLLESLARLELVQAGVRVVPQKWIDGVGYVDLLVEDCLVVELDGFAYHGNRRQFRRDRQRDRELVRRGFRVLRYAFEDVIDTPEIVVSDVQKLLARI